MCYGGVRDAPKNDVNQQSSSPRHLKCVMVGSVMLLRMMLTNSRLPHEMFYGGVRDAPKNDVNQQSSSPRNVLWWGPCCS